MLRIFADTYQQILTNIFQYYKMDSEDEVTGSFYIIEETKSKKKEKQNTNINDLVIIYCARFYTHYTIVAILN